MNQDTPPPVPTTRRFLVVVHDVAPVFSAPLRRIVRELEPLLGDRFAAAVVPCWHGGQSGITNRAYLDLLDCFGERLLHGWTHRREHRNGLVSLLTGRAEFRGLDSSVICRRIEAGQAEFEQLTGRQATGLVPPAWQLPIRATELESLRFVMRFRSLESCTHADAVRPLATWSWDWGRIGWLAPGGEILGRFLQWRRPLATPCIAIHPIDVQRGWLPRVVRLIRALLEANHEPALGAELLSLGEGRP